MRGIEIIRIPTSASSCKQKHKHMADKEKYKCVFKLKAALDYML